MLIIPSSLLLLLSLLLLSPASSFSCTSSYPDCEANGECTSGTCTCYRGWKGPSCGSLDLAPISLPAAHAWPLPIATNASSWGFSSILDADGSYHALAAVACGAAGVIGSGGGESWVAHLTSASPLGPWTLSPSAPMFTPQTTFGPHITVTGEGTLAVVFRVNVLLNSTLCSGNSSGVEPAGLVSGALIPPSSLASGDPEQGTSIYIATAKAMAGPWQARNVSILGGGGVHKSNPSISYLATPAADGSRYAMAYRDNPGKGERLALALALAVGGPYTDVRNISFCPQTDRANGCEDPFFFQDPRNASLAHIVYHNGPTGWHLVGALDGSEGWGGSPTGAAAYTLNVQLAGGGTLALLRRERPELHFRPDGSPSLLITGATSMEGPTLRAWSLLQEVQ